MYWKFFYKILSLIDPETAHNLIIKIIKNGFLPKIKTKSIPLKVMNIKFQNPIGLAAGFDKNAETINQIHKLGFGFSEVGTITVFPQEGNPKPRIFRLPEDKAIINRNGFNNDGLTLIKNRIKDFRKNNKFSNIKLGINIGPNKDSSDRIKDYTKLIHEFAKYADYLAINISSPNTPNLRKLHSDKNFKNLIISIKKEINKLNNCPPILIKISPDLSNTELKKIIKETVNYKLHGLIISNTTIKRNVKSKYKEETGGLSGEPLFQESTKVLIMARKILNDFGSRISIIATGGVYDGKSAYIKILCGADLIQLYTGLVYKGPFVVKNILDQLDRYRKRDNIKNWEDVRGLAKSINEANKIAENGLNKKT